VAEWGSRRDPLLERRREPPQVLHFDPDVIVGAPGGGGAGERFNRTPGKSKVKNGESGRITPMAVHSL